MCDRLVSLQRFPTLISEITMAECNRQRNFDDLTRFGRFKPHFLLAVQCTCAETTTIAIFLITPVEFSDLVFIVQRDIVPSIQTRERSLYISTLLQCAPIKIHFENRDSVICEIMANTSRLFSCHPLHDSPPCGPGV